MVEKHRLILIAAVDNNWAIGKDNNLIYNVPTDMAHFRKKTLNNIIVYGFNTLMSFPQRKILPKRDNIILTSKIIACGSDRMYVAHSIDDVLKIISEFDDDRDVYICGGASVYRQFLDIADEACITLINAETDGADAFFPNLYTESNWVESNHEYLGIDEASGLELNLYTYKHK